MKDEVGRALSNVGWINVEMTDVELCVKGRVRIRRKKTMGQRYMHRDNQTHRQKHTDRVGLEVMQNTSKEGRKERRAAEAACNLISFNTIK